jgi:anti-sigma regulatory factor (Ser/Thr protein kinase)
VAAVADALNGVHQRAIELAVDQAALRRNVAEAFMNLGRRNQNLVARQLDLISQLEQHEDDPSTMEELFHLDHLATRMRRNAESLLVMAGTGAGSPWADAASAVDVVRAASAGVEDYRRLRLRHFDHAVIAAAATGDVVHILAELMENALSFSPPHATVELYGRALPTGYTISVVDNGIGMTAEERDFANARLEGGGNLSEAANRHLGLVVAGRLAARQGISVGLHDADAGGIAARLRIPPELIESSVAGPSALDGAPVAFPNRFSPDVTPEASAGALSDQAPRSRDATAAPPVAGADPADLGRFAGAEGADSALAASVAFAASAWPSPPAGSPPHPEGDGAALLPRRIPGAALPQADDTLRRDTAAAPPSSHQALSAALSDYLSIRSEPNSPPEDIR